MKKFTREQKETIETGGLLGQTGMYQPEPPPPPASSRKGLGEHKDAKKIQQENIKTAVISEDVVIYKPRVIATWLNRVHLQRKYKEPGGGYSRTVPDQSLTIKELILRQQRGYPLDAVKPVFYNGEEDDLPDIRKMDLTQIHEMREWADQKIKEDEKIRKQKAWDHQREQTEAYYKKKFTPAPSAGNSEPSPGQNEK